MLYAECLEKPPFFRITDTSFRIRSLSKFNLKLYSLIILAFLVLNPQKHQRVKLTLY